MFYKTFNCAIFVACLVIHSLPGSVTQSSRQNPVLRGLRIDEEFYNDTLAATQFLLSKPITDFSGDIYKTLLDVEQNNRDNIILSPFSIHAALTMLYYGSREGTNTRRELYNALGSGTDTEKFNYAAFHYLNLLQQYERIRNVDVEVANKIFTHQGFEPKTKFLDFLKLYLTSAETVNFGSGHAAARRINQFVNGKTRGLIRKIVSSNDFDHLTRLVLINVIYFKADWKYKFDRQDTGRMDFTLLDNSVIQHRRGMRTTANFRSGRSRELNARVLELPYANENFNMYILIPENNNLQSLNRLAASFDMSKVENSLRSSFRSSTEVTMPAFDISFKIDLKKILKQMGTTSMFNPRNGDFGVISDQDLFVSDVLHRAQIKVNEEGSEAAAATAVIMGLRSGQTRTQEFRVDEPFIYVIYDNLNRFPLFIGRILNPSS